MKPHIHTPGDGRGRRKVMVDGQEVKRVVYADTLRGEVRCIDDPIRIVGGEAAWHTLRGRVTVEPAHG